MINPIWLLSFVEAVNRSAMRAAAMHLRITPAAVSKHILAIENALGIQLLKRSTRRLDLTPEGQLYFEHAKRILETYQEAEAALSHSKEEPSGMFRIICGPHMANSYLIPHLKRFLGQYPKLRLNLEITQTLPDLEKEKVDVIVGLKTGIPLNYVQKTLVYTRWVFCASPEYLKTFGIPKKPSDLVHHRIITLTPRNPNDVIEFKSGESIHFEPYLYLNDTRAIRKIALQGLGIVQLYDYIIERDLQEGKLIEILQKHNEQKCTMPVQISYLQTPHLHIKIRKFIDFMVGIFKSGQ